LNDLTVFGELSRAFSSSFTPLIEKNLQAESGRHAHSMIAPHRMDSASKPSVLVEHGGFSAAVPHAGSA